MHYRAREVAVELERRDLARVRGPLGPLVADEPLEDVLAERLGHELGPLHVVDGLVQAAGQRPDPLGGQLLGRQREEIGGGLGRQLVALLDAPQPGRQHHGEGEVRVAGGVRRPVLDAGRLHLAPLDDRAPGRAPSGCCGPSETCTGAS